MTPEEQKQHEYLLMEFRLMIEDVKADHREALAPLITDVTVLKTSYGFIYGGLALLGSGMAYIFYWMFGHVQETHTVAKQMASIVRNIRVC